MDLAAIVDRLKGSGRLAGKIAFITGAGGGQGQAAALMFAAAGAAVVASDVQENGVATTSELAGKMGLTIDIVVGDAADEADVTTWIDSSVERHGGIDILYNNAAHTHFAPIGEMTLEQWRETLRLELDIVFLPTRAAWRHLVARGGGSIINVASVSGMQATEGIGASAHAAGKSGVIGLTRQLALEGAPHAIRANSISPGPIVTPVTKAYMDIDAAFKRRFEGFPMLGRVGVSSDVAFAALYLASDESAFVTASNMVVDGGWLAKGGFTEH